MKNTEIYSECGIKIITFGTFDSNLLFPVSKRWRQIMLLASILFSLLFCRPLPQKPYSPKHLPEITPNLLIKFQATNSGATKVPDSSLPDLPYVTTGLLNLMHGNQNHVCSATLIQGADGKKYIQTAAHCIFDPNQKTWFTSASFCMAKSGSDPCALQYRIKNISIMTMFQRFLSPGSIYTKIPNVPFSIYDQAILSLQIQPDEAAIPISFNSPVAKQSISLGYQYISENWFMYQYQTDKIVISPGGNELQTMLGNNLTHGASGGSWIAPTNDGKYFVTGLNSSGAADDPARQPQMISPYFSSNESQLHQCATSGSYCDPHKLSDGSFTNPVVTFAQKNNYATWKEATYFSEGLIASIHYRTIQNACSGEPLSYGTVEFNFVSVSKTGTLKNIQCFNLGQGYGLLGYNLLTLRQKGLPKLLITSHGRPDGQFELNSFKLKKDGTTLDLLSKNTTPDSGDLTDIISMKQVLENNFAVMKKRNGQLLLEIWKANYDTGELSFTESSKLGPGIGSFSATAMVSASSNTPQLLIAANVSGQITLYSYSVNPDLSISDGPVLYTDLQVNSSDGYSQSVIQMDNGVILVGYVDPDNFTNIATFFYSPNSINYLNSMRRIIQKPDKISLADIGNNIAVALMSGDALPQASILSLNITDNGNLISLKNYANQSANVGAVIPVYYGIQPALSKAMVGYFGTEMVANGSFYLNTLNVDGTTDVRFATIAYEIDKAKKENNVRVNNHK